MACRERIAFSHHSVRGEKLGMLEGHTGESILDVGAMIRDFEGVGLLVLSTEI